MFGGGKDEGSFPILAWIIAGTGEAERRWKS